MVDYTMSTLPMTETGVTCGLQNAENFTGNYSGLSNVSCETKADWSYDEYLDFPEYYVSVEVYKILIMTFFGVGTVGNVLTLVVLSRNAMSGTSSCIYMRALAVSDTSVLWAYLASLLGSYYYKTIAITWFCRTVYMFQATGSMYSGWLMISMTTERWIAVTWPFKAGTMFTKKKAIITVISLAFIVTGLNLHYFWTATSIDNDCLMDYANFKKFHLLWAFIDISLTIYIPAFTIMILNILIIVQLKRAQRTQKKLTCGDDRPSHPTRMRKGTKYQTRENTEQQKEINSKEEEKNVKGQGKSNQTKQITTMLLSVSITYWFLMFPVAVYYLIIDYILEPYTPRRWALIWLFMYLCYGLMLLNHCINFVLYCLTGSRFRKEIKRMFVYKKKAQASNASGASHSQVTTLSSAPSISVSSSDVKATISEIV